MFEGMKANVSFYLNIEFALKLGYGLPPISILSHWDGQPLRYLPFPFPPNSLPHISFPLLHAYPPAPSHPPIFLPPEQTLTNTSTHTLRYVLKNTLTNTPLFVINLQLIPTPEAEKKGEADAEEMFGSVHKDDTSPASKGDGKDGKEGEGKEGKEGRTVPGGFGADDDELD